jgi:hypothetical protein
LRILFDEGVSQLKALVLEEKGKIKYGLHVSEQSVMSCYVRDMKKGDQIHFVDGAGGGYTVKGILAIS